ncbi:MAG: PilW family protein, partial [Thiopseudomonas sp.]
QIYIDNRSSYLFHQGQSETIENGRYALLILEQQLAKTGYRRSPDDSFEFAFPAITDATTGCRFAAGQTIVRVDESTLCLRYQPRDDAERNCAYEPPAFSGSLDTPYNAFTESFVARFAVTDEVLTCNGVELATGVSDIRFDFGVGPAGRREVTEYTATPDRPIRGLRYALLMASERGNRQGMSSKAYEDWHGREPSDNRLYHAVSNSITLRNLMP